MLKVSVVAAFAAVVIACGDGVGPEGVAIDISPRFIADTIESPVPSEVRIKVREGSSSLPDGNVLVSAYGINVSTDPADLYKRTFTLDAQGTLTVFLFMGREARETFLHVVVGDYRDSISVSILPGRQVGVGFPSADTVLRPEEVYSVKLHAIDRLGNRRSETVEPLTLESSNQDVATVHGTSVTAVATGATTLRATTHIGEATSTAFVLPDAALMVNPGPLLVDGYGAVLADLAPFPEVSKSDCPSWHPDGGDVLVSGLRTLRPDGSTSQITVNETGLIPGCGAYSANGEWIFFDGRLTTDPENASSIWRVRVDGSELNRITIATAGERQVHPSPAPDGSRVVYSSGTALVVHTLESATADTLIREEFFPIIPRWSPAGDWIAYTYPKVGIGVRIHGYIWADQLKLIRPDGSHDYTAARLSGGAQWSPDGEWLVGATFYNDRLIFIRPSTGEVLRSLPSTAQYRNPLWRP